VADVADDRLILHLIHVGAGDDVLVARGGDEDIGLVGRVLHRDDPEALHRGLQGADRVDLGDPDLGGKGAQGLCGTLADVAVPTTTATLPAIMTSVARLMPSTSDSRQP
jgi:hypothetical protein